ncbi:hypothetical protein PSP6_390017 [Paraburkholderia tropica]|nr:hypothetical protein PSP6_390017 [Paraburkholderia tropica]
MSGLTRDRARGSAQCVADAATYAARIRTTSRRTLRHSVTLNYLTLKIFRPTLTSRTDHGS